MEKMNINSPHHNALVVECKEGFWGIVLEVPGAASQAPTKEKLIENLKNAVLTMNEYKKSTLQTAFDKTIKSLERKGVHYSKIAVPCY